MTQAYLEGPHPARQVADWLRRHFTVPILEVRALVRSRLVSAGEDGAGDGAFQPNIAKVTTMPLTALYLQPT
jgi:hypothetical protein